MAGNTRVNRLPPGSGGSTNVGSRLAQRLSSPESCASPEAVRTATLLRNSRSGCRQSVFAQFSCLHCQRGWHCRSAPPTQVTRLTLRRLKDSGKCEHSFLHLLCLLRARSYKSVGRVWRMPTGDLRRTSDAPILPPALCRSRPTSANVARFLVSAGEHRDFPNDRRLCNSR